jgi:carboxyl-terminal processing protease
LSHFFKPAFMKLCKPPFLLAFALCAVMAASNFALAQDKAKAVETSTATKADSHDKKAAAPADDGYELFELLADTVDQIDRNYVKEVDRRELIEAAIRGMMTKLDPYSSYIDPEELAQFRSSVDSEFAGIGVQVSNDDGDLTVLSPIYGTPAYRAGIQAGDRIVEIEGHSTEGLLTDDAIRLMKGPDGSKVTLTVVHGGQSKREKFTLTRERVRVETVLGDRRKTDDHWDFMYDAKNSIGYVRISAFSLDTAKELRDAMADLKKRKVRGLVLDLRFNPGGLLRSAIEVSKLYVSKGRIVSTKGRSSPERFWDADGRGTFEGFPMVVLVNRYSASASEIVSACLQDHQRAVIMGERTWGKGSVQNIIELEHGRSALKLTTAAYRRPSGKNIHRFPDAKDSDPWGVMPDLGYELALNDRETRELAANRRQRDIIAAHTDDKSAAVIKDEPLARGTGAVKADAKPSSTDTQSTLIAAKNPFVDRQLEMAMKYLREQLAKK